MKCSRVSERSHADEARSARLLLGFDMPADALTAEMLCSRAVRSAVRSRRAPSSPHRFLQRVQRKLGGLEYERAVAQPLQAARLAALGAQAAGAPRFLVRVDEFPHYLAWDEPERYGTERFRRFHELMAGAGVPYLIAVPPRISHAPLDPQQSRWRAPENGERELLAKLPSEGVAFALHGLDHRTRFSSPRRHSELCGLDRHATEQLIDTGIEELAALGISAEVFVAPYNRFDVEQYDVLASRFAVVCGGPESVGLIGFQRTPLWRGEAVYLPSYHPLYGHAHEVMPAAQSLIEQRMALWAPIALHWGWEADEDWTALERLLEVIAPHTAHWEDFLAAVHASTDGEAGASSSART